ncbi:MAG TPA: MauE/DoxX family redox-associated membrane protein [Solirubrobacteraceae bacterium]|nr:MauE/DoxX family redox-associated membrane protein [Solirubrobacteraceae bacterium]
MAQALTGPYLIAALTLCVAGLAKLRAPSAAARAMRAARLPANVLAIRTVAGGELALGAAAAMLATPATAVALAAVYAAFAALALVLHRRGAECGCFGDSGMPASPLQSAISALLAVVCALAAAASTHGIPWVLGRSPSTATILILGIGAAVYATVAAYSELPSAWTAWGGR